MVPVPYHSGGKTDTYGPIKCSNFQFEFIYHCEFDGSLASLMLKLKSILPVFFCMLLFQTGMASGVSDSLRSLHMSNEEITLWLEVRILELTEESGSTLQEYSFELAKAYAEAGDYEKALTALSLCLSEGERLENEVGFLYRDAVNYKASYLIKLHQIKTAERWIRANIDREIDDWRFVKLCFFYAQSLKQLGDLNLATDYLEKALRISESIGDDRYAARSITRLSQIYLQTNNLDGIQWLDSQLDKYEYMKRPEYRMPVRFNLLIALLNAGYYEEALEISSEVITYGRSAEMPDYVVFGLLNKGFCELKLLDYSAAKASLKEAVHFESARSHTYNNLAEVFLTEGNADSAVVYSRLSLLELGFGRADLQSGFVQRAAHYPDKALLMTIIHDLSRALTGQNTDDALEEAMRLNDLLDRIIDELRLTTTEQQSQHFWREEVRPIYEDALKAAVMANDKEKAFFYAEKSKAILLLDDLVKNTTARDGSLPDSLLDAEFQFKQNIFNIELKMQSSEALGKDSLEDLRLLEKRKLNALIQQMAEIAPQYVNTKYTPSISSIPDLQDRIAKDELVLSFIWADNIIYRFYSDDRGSGFDAIPVEESFVADLHLLLTNLQRPLSRIDEINKSNQASYSVYQVLLGGMDLGDKRLSIFPDGMLYYLPFEALMINDDSNHPEYLIERHIVNYGFSINTFYVESIDTESKDVLAFAPNSYDGSLQLQDLNFVDFEMEFLPEKHTSWLVDESALRQKLLDGLSDKRLIHIYSHAAANDLSQPHPWIAARNDRIYLPEIYNHKTNANLVILSACETNLGKEILGEGVISLARGFFHSGSGSVLASLWSVNDRSNSEIVHYFYEFLGQGHTKAAALRLSKLRYIEAHKIEARSPYYWAGPVYIGQDGQLILESRNTTWIKWLIAVALLLIAAGGMSRMKMREKG